MYRNLKLGRYRHFKGGIYQLLEFAEHTESGEMLAIYVRDDFTGKVWARPIDMFISKVPPGRHNPTGQEYRFEYID
jgi:hypothetical protein